MKNRHLIFAALGLLIAGCADATPVQIYCFDDCHEYGFWGGLWHGFILVDRISRIRFKVVKVYTRE